MHTFIQSPDGTYTVGHYRQVGSSTDHSPSYEWVPMIDYTNQDDAATMVSFLNGGAGSSPPTPTPQKKAKAA